MQVQLLQVQVTCERTLAGAGGKVLTVIVVGAWVITAFKLTPSRTNRFQFKFNLKFEVLSTVLRVRLSKNLKPTGIREIMTPSPSLSRIMQSITTKVARELNKGGSGPSRERR